MMRRLCLALLMLLESISAASAHTRSQSFSAWTVGATALEGVYQVDAYRATQLSETPQDLVKLLRSHLDARVYVEQLGQRCKRDVLQPLSAPRGDLKVELKFTCFRPFAEAEAKLVIGGFFDVSISHVHYARLNYSRERMDEVVLTQGQQTIGVGADSAKASTSFVAMLVLGAEHVLSGADHIAFLLALMMLAGSARATVWSVTGFTLGHSVTLALVTLGLLSPQTSSIEALIGFTVAWAAGDALARRREMPKILGMAGALGIVVVALLGALAGSSLVPWPVLLGVALFAVTMSYAGGQDSARVAPVVATVFGLAHGAGFAGPLLELKIAPGDLLWTLLAFNLGVEAGQLIVVLLVAASLLFLKRMPVPLPRMSYDVLAAGLFGLGVFWFVSRSLA